MTTKQQWKSHGCTIATVDDWKDGRNYGGKRIACTGPISPDDMPSQTQIDLASLIAQDHNNNITLGMQNLALKNACKAMLDIAERIGPLPIQQGALCEEQDWDSAIRQARAALALGKEGDK